MDVKTSTFGPVAPISLKAWKELKRSFPRQPSSDYKLVRIFKNQNEFFSKSIHEH